MQIILHNMKKQYNDVTMKRKAVFDTGVAYVVETSKDMYMFYDKDTLRPREGCIEMPIGSYLAHFNGYPNPVDIDFEEPE